MNLGEMLVNKYNDSMLFKKNCFICNNRLSKSELKEYETAQGNKIFCCEECSKYIKLKI